MTEEFFNNSEKETTSNFIYPIYDQTDILIDDPDLSLGFLKKENLIIYHESIPEKWHYAVQYFEFKNGETYIPVNENDPHIKIINAEKGIFTYQNLEGEQEQIVTKQVVIAIIDQAIVPAWEEEKTIYRYIPYTEKELSDKMFLNEGPILLTEAQETIDDLLIAVADLLGGIDE